MTHLPLTVWFLTMKYWDPHLETLPRDELDQIELSYFKNILSYSKNNSIMYRGKLKAFGVP